MSDAKHTPTPWAVQKDGVTIYQCPKAFLHRAKVARALEVFMDKSEREANAAFIVQAVNAHKALVEALTMALPHVPGGAVHPIRIHDEKAADCQLRAIIKAALTLAGAVK